MIDYWYMFPVAIVISTIAMMIGIGGAVLFSPFFILVLGIEPVLALGAGLFIEVFGFASGIIGYVRAKAINYRLFRKLIVVTLPATMIGVGVGRLLDALILEMILAMIILLISLDFLFFEKEMNPKDPRYHPKPRHKRAHITKVTYALASMGGLFLGMVSAGLGESNEYSFLKRQRLYPAVAAGTSVCIVACSAVVGVLTHLWYIMEEGRDIFSQAFAIAAFAIPGVIIGAQIGVKLAQKIRADYVETFVGSLFGVISILIIIGIFA